MKLATPKLLTLRFPAFTRIHLTLVGVGGTGSHIASGLAAIALDLSERAVHSDITFMDPDKVEAKNVGRQLFAYADIGKPKAVVVAERLNASYNLAIGASVRWIDDTTTFLSPSEGALNIVVGAVDNPAARSIIAKMVKRAEGKLWWLDCGNENHSGQVCIGNSIKPVKPALGFVDSLPAPHIVYPDLVKNPNPFKKTKRDPSCAELTASGEQGLMINRLVAAQACSMLNDFISGQLRYFALAFDAQWGGAKSYALDEKTLKNIGN